MSLLWENGRTFQDLSGLEADTGSSGDSFPTFHSFDDSFVEMAVVDAWLGSLNERFGICWSGENGLLGAQGVEVSH